MAEETLVKEVLTQEMISAGSVLMKALDDAGWEVIAAFWLYDLESNRWNLVFASPAVERDGFTASYGVVFDTRDVAAPTLPVDSIRVDPPNQATVVALRAFASKRHNTDGRVVRGYIERHWIEDSYVYRALPLAPEESERS